MIVAKFYSSLRDTLPFTQVFLYDKVEIEDDLLVYWIAKFTMPLVTWVEEDTVCKLYEVGETWLDTRIFSWYVQEIKPFWNKWGQAEVMLRSEKAILEKRHALWLVRFYEVDYYWPVPNRATDTNPSDSFWKTYYNWTWLIQWIRWEHSDLDWISDSRSISYTKLEATSYIKIANTWYIWMWNWSSATNLWSISWVVFASIISSLLVRRNTYWEHRTREIDIDDNVQINIEIWDNIFDILEELREQYWFYRDIQDWKLTIKELLWVDRTNGDLYEEVLFDWNNPSSSKIKEINVVWVAQRSNVVIAKRSEKNRADKYWYNLIVSNIVSSKVYWSSLEEVREWNFIGKANKKLELLNVQIRSYDVEIEENSIYAGTGDKIYMEVINTNDFFNFSGDVLIVWKKTVYEKWKKETYKIQQFTTRTFTQQERGRQVSKLVKYNQI